MQTEVQMANILLWVEYDFYEAEKQTYDYPGSPPSADIYSIYVGGVDIYELMNSDQLEWIEEKIINQHI